MASHAMVVSRVGIFATTSLRVTLRHQLQMYLEIDVAH